MPCKDPEKLKAYNKAYYEANREKRKAWDKAYYEANREKLNAGDKAYREANREKRKAWDKVYYIDPLNSARHSIYKLTGLKKAEIPTELLEAQALIISINREIKNHEKLHRA